MVDTDQAIRDLQMASDLVSKVAGTLNLKGDSCCKCGRVTYESRDEQLLHAQLSGVAEKIQTLSGRVRALSRQGGNHGEVDRP